MKYELIPESTAEMTPELAHLESLWTTLKMTLVRNGRLVTPGTKDIIGAVNIGEELGLITAQEATWMRLNAYWITPTEDFYENAPFWIEKGWEG